MRTDYSAPSIDTESALRQSAATEQVVANFISPRTLASGTGALTTGTRASRPVGPALNDQYFETDTGWLYYWGGTAFLYSAGINVGTDAARAAIAVTADDNGALFFTNNQNKLWRVEGGVWVDKFVTLDLTTSLKIAATKVVGAREAGWTAGTGTANKGAFATYAGQDVSAAYVEAEAQATDDATKANSQRIKAIEDALRTHGLIN
jgi:hypothetical protein